ncbi:MAG: 30S ribosomal protein S1 [Solirubrobacteraceae bacterium]
MPAEQPNAKVVEGSNGLLLEIDGKIVPNYDATIHPFQEGDVVTGHVVRIDSDEVLVDIGYKSEGVIPAGELSIRKSVDPSDEVSLGEEVDALVLTKEDQDGRLILSKKRARFEKAWRRIEAAAESGDPVEGQVIEVVKGGLIIDLGVRGFLPASLVDIRRVPNLDEYMGQAIDCKVIELNRSRNNVVLSRRAVLEEQRKEDRERILDRLQPGQVVEGQISNIVDFGAFVDLDGIDGLIHISELSWSHVNHPSEILSIGDTVSVKVLDIDRQRQRISLGLKQTQEDPWQRVVNTYNIGDELEGNVTKVVTFGAFVEILDGVEGLVHISELAQHHVENPREIIQPGDPVRVKILEIDAERRRLSLSIKRVEGQVLPVRPIIPPAEGDAGDLEDMPELGLSEDVFSGEGQQIGSDDPGLSEDVFSGEGQQIGSADPEAALGSEAYAEDERPRATGSSEPTAGLPSEDVLGGDSPEAGEAFVPEADVPEADVAGAYEPEADASDAYAPEADAPEADAPEAYAQEADMPETEAPEAGAPEAGYREADWPGAGSAGADEADAIHTARSGGASEDVA